MGHRKEFFKGRSYIGTFVPTTKTSKVCKYRQIKTYHVLTRTDSQISQTTNSFLIKRRIKFERFKTSGLHSRLYSGLMPCYIRCLYVNIHSATEKSEILNINRKSEIFQFIQGKCQNISKTLKLSMKLLYRTFH